MKFNELKTRDDLAIHLKIPRRSLTYLLYKVKPENSYNDFFISKKSGGKRKISSPTSRLKSVQRKLNESMLNFMEESDFPKSKIAYGYSKEKSIVFNSKNHVKKKFVINIDIKDFFESINFGRVRGFFINNKYFKMNTEVSTIIAQLTCYNNSLPQGAPTSPLISNLIGQILDYKISKICNKYKLVYTRYVDDLTFSTNDDKIIKNYSSFIDEIDQILNKSGFQRNINKTRIQYRNSRQVVTGLVVNRKISIPREYYKDTRSMLHSLISNGEFYIDKDQKIVGNLNQLEGRFTFIDHIEKYNNNKNKAKSLNNKSPDRLCTKEKQFQKFLFYKQFFVNERPLIITEGKTDILYLKAALKNLHKQYPELITKNKDGKFQFKIQFFERTRRNKYFYNIDSDGADTLKQIYDFFSKKNRKKGKNIALMEELKSLSNRVPLNPVILLFDNETVKSKKSSKPLLNFINYITTFLGDQKQDQMVKTQLLSHISQHLHVNIKDNLFVATNPLKHGQDESEIEDLFEINDLTHVINGVEFNYSKNKASSNTLDKNQLSKIVSQKYQDISFANFIPLFDSVNSLIMEYKNKI